MNSIFRFVGLALVVLGVVRERCKAQATGDPSGLRVAVNLSRTNVPVGETFKVSLRVKNSATTNQSVLVWNCTWSWNWKADNTNIVLLSQACLKNRIGRVEIEPGGAYANEGEMTVRHSIPGGKVFFRMGFTPFTGGSFLKSPALGTTVWSDEIAIGVTP